MTPQHQERRERIIAVIKRAHAEAGLVDPEWIDADNCATVVADALIASDQEGDGWEPEDQIGPPTPLGALKFRMEQGGHTQADLGRLIGSRSHAAEILSGKRQLSKVQIATLVDTWGIPARSLLGPALPSAPRQPESGNG